MAHNESLVSHFCFLYKQLPFIISVGGIPNSARVFLVSAAHNSSSEAASCSVMVLVYFRALSLVTFHSSPVLRSRVVGKCRDYYIWKIQKNSAGMIDWSSNQRLFILTLLFNCKSWDENNSNLQDPQVLRSRSWRGGTWRPHQHLLLMHFHRASLNLNLEPSLPSSLFFFPLSSAQHSSLFIQ